MKFYEEYLSQMGFQVNYIEYQVDWGKEVNASMVEVFERLFAGNIKIVHILDPIDWALNKRIKEFSSRKEIEIKVYDNPGFLCTRDDIESFFRGKKKYLQTSFYIHQRKNHNILIKEGKPEGGKWTFDKENRKKLPKTIDIPPLPKLSRSKYIEEAIDYISEKFPLNPGNADNFFYPVTFNDTLNWFKSFLKNRFKLFGPYEDAVRKDNHYLFHSILSPLLNIGLITPEKLIKETLNYSKKINIPLNSLEGFLRQIIGWREFMRAIYIREYKRRSKTEKSKLLGKFTKITLIIL
jgi:deoxyribodipyrimidine photolyase-related protein